MYGTVFEKMKGRGGTEQVIMQKQPSKGFLKKVLWEISRNPQESICAGKMGLRPSCFLVTLVKFVRSIFLQNTTGLLLIIAAWIEVKGELKNETVNYDIKTKG